MGYIYKLKPEIVKFILNKKHSLPEISCRKLSQEVKTKFDISLSKSLINNLLKREKLSSSVGRRPMQIFNLENKLDHGGFFLFQAIDYFLNISIIAAGVLNKIIPAQKGVKLKDIQSVIQAFFIFKSLYDVTLDITGCYNNKEIWTLLGYRPTRVAYKRIVEMINNSELFAEQLVRELKENIKPISGFRFILSDESSIFVDGQLQSIWQTSPSNTLFNTTYYIANSYINKLSENKEVFSIFNIQGSTLLSPEIFDLISAFNSEPNSKRFTHFEILDLANNVVEKKFIFGSERRFFLLGFWPWQLDIMYELERKPAKNKISFSMLGLEYFYQIEEVLLSQPFTTERVKLKAIILKNTPLGAAKIAILTNIPEDKLHNYLSIKWLHHWIFPEEKYKIFTAKTGATSSKNIFSILIEEIDNKNIVSSENSLDKVFELLSKVIFKFFQTAFIPVEVKDWSPLKIKDVFLRQQATIQRGKEVVVHKTIISNELCKENFLRYICQELNNLGIKDEQERLLWFKFQQIK